MSHVSRGFHGRRREPEGTAGRVPPGQYVTEDFPVLSAGPTPRTPLGQWTFTVGQPGGAARSWTWAEIRALPDETVTTDIHCVTRWSKLDTHWQAVSLDTLLAQVDPRCGVRPGLLRRRVHDQPAAGGPDGRPGLAGVRL